MPTSGPATRSTSSAPRPRLPCCSTRSWRGPRSSRTSSVVHLHTEGPGPHLAPEMAPPLPPPGAVHRAQRAPGRERGPGGVHPGLPVGRAAPLLGRSAARSMRCSSTSRRPMPTASARWARRSRRCRPRSRPRASVIAQLNRGDAAHARRELRPRRRHRLWRSRWTGRPTSYAGPGDRRDRAADRRVRRRPGAGRRHPPDGHRRDPQRRGPVPAATRRTWGSTPRCSPTPSSTSWRRGRHRDGARSATGARSSAPS